MVTRVWEIDLAYTGYLKPIRVENARSWLFYYNNDGYIYIVLLLEPPLKFLPVRPCVQ